jgi:hypothetical protein
MRERQLDVLSAQSAGVARRQPRVGSWSTADRSAWRSEDSGALEAESSVGGSGTPTRAPLAPRRAPAGIGGFMASDDELLERTLAFSGSYVSDDGNVTVRRVASEFEYSGHRFLGNCTVCSRALLVPLAGEPLSDVRAAILFVAAHDHGDVD